MTAHDSGLHTHDSSILDEIDEVASSTPVLLLAYRRPDLVSQVIASLRKVAPRVVFAALDGPRETEEPVCAETERTVRDQIDWPCDLELLVRPTNRGCRLGVSEAIDWFFDHVEAGIILEDDTVPSASFFTYCADLLDRYALDERVWMISGTNLLSEWPTPYSYFFGDGGVWGWATWRRAWLQSDTAFDTWTDHDARRAARAFYGRREWRRLAPEFDAVHRNLIDTWDYQWSYARATHHGLSVIPTVNLVTNIGFDSRATHTGDGDSPFAGLAARDLGLPLTHPREVSFDRGYQRAAGSLQRYSRWSALKGRILRMT